MEHLPGPYPRKPDRPCAGRLLTSRGHNDVHYYRLRLDRLEVDDVRFCTYGDHRGVHPFQILCNYSKWLMCGKQRVYCHLPERVKRQFEFCTGGSQTSILCRLDASAGADHCVARRSGVVIPSLDT